MNENTSSFFSASSLEPQVLSKYTYEEVEIDVKGKEKLVQELLDEVFQMYKPQEIMLAFNGGKDCTVVLHMIETFIKRSSYIQHLRIPTLYIEDPNAFPEVDEFVEDCAKLYNIELIKMRGTIKEALQIFCLERPYTKAVFMGCRRTDPYCKDLNIMQSTDPGYPPLMRVNPIINWTCRDIWQYIFIYKVPYCILYQKGYTSIGNRKNTIPNPYLKGTNIVSGNVLGYRPGHELLDNDELERAGRI